MKLVRYRSKRNLNKSKEPAAKLKKGKNRELVFVIQEHHAKRLHYDLRLEAEGVLKSWAIPKIPSLSPKVKRLAIQVEDHPYGYKDFEGTIPSGYGAGTVSIWDQGTYNVGGEDAAFSEEEVRKGLKKGSLHLFLKGKKLQGLFHLFRLKNSKKNEWLFTKAKEEKGAAEGVKLTHLERVYWPRENITKGALVEYYAEVADWILPFLKDRPVSLKRFPNGIEGLSFFQRDLKAPPDWIETVPIQHEKKVVHYLLIQNKESLLYAANLGCIELHPFLSRVQRLDRPDFLILDLDPKGASFLDVIKVAQTIHQLLERIEVPSYCKTSGATGLHIAIPMGAKYQYQHVRAFGKIIATLVHNQIPNLTTLERSILKRQGKVYLDFQQNHFAQTIVSPYSVRARLAAPVSTPLLWKEVKKGFSPEQYNLRNTLRRLEKMGDIYAPVLEKGIHLPTALKNISLILSELKIILKKSSKNL